MSSEVTVKQRGPTMSLGHCCGPSALLINNVFQQWGHGSHYCATMSMVMRVAYLVGNRDRQTDRRGQSRQVFIVPDVTNNQLNRKVAMKY
jgi:hypothetical protein